MQRTTRIMFAHYIVRSLALDVVWMRKRRRHVLSGNFDYARVKAYHIYSGEPFEMLTRNMDYPSPLFDKARKLR